MEMRAKIADTLKTAMKEKAADRLSTLRLINAAIKDRDIALRGEGNEAGASDAEILSILSKMVKQRQESVRAYEEGGRLDLAEQEEREIAIIAEFLPRQMDADEIAKAISATLSDIGATSIRDMGKVMGALKSRYNGQMDFGKVGPMVKDQLCASSQDC